MARHSLHRATRLTLIAALLGALLAAGATTVSAAAALAPTPGTASPVAGRPNTYAIPFTSSSSALDVDCGAPAAQCSIYVARNNGAKSTEALFANVTGTRVAIPAAFINDGCFNFRLYDSSHFFLLAPQVNIGHDISPISVGVCNADGTGQALVLVNGSPFAGVNFPSGKSGLLPNAPLAIEWDSGFAGGVEDSQVWVSQSKPGFPFTDCAAIAYPNPSEVLYAQNVSGEQGGLNLLGGGKYCFTLYQGTSHTTRIAGPSAYELGPYLAYAGGAANGGLDPTQGTVFFASGNGAVNALVCVWGAAIPGSDSTHQVPFTFNGEGWNPGGTGASFQTAGKGAIEYQLRIDVGALDTSGGPTAASCASGLLEKSFTITT